MINPVRKICMSMMAAGVVCFLVSCVQQTDPAQKTGQDAGKLKDPLITANKHLVENEDAMINDFIQRYQWNMNQTPSGLRWMVYRPGAGAEVKPGDRVSLKYSLKLLDGSLVYSSESDGNKVFIQGKNEVEKGLDDGILFLKEGDLAKFIIPSHLAFGLLGDQHKIPARATLIYDIEVVSVNSESVNNQ